MNELEDKALKKEIAKGLFTWRWGTPGRWGNPLMWGKKITLLYMQSYNPAIPGALSQNYWVVAKHANKKNADKPRVLAINAPYTPLLLLLKPSVLWLSIVNFDNNAKQPPKWILREFDVSRIRPRPGGLPHLETFTWQNLTPAERVTRSGRPGYPPWWVTPPIM